MEYLLPTQASEALSSSISKNQKKSFKPGHLNANLSIKIDTPKCLEITVVMLLPITPFYCEVESVQRLKPLYLSLVHQSLNSKADLLSKVHLNTI